MKNKQIKLTDLLIEQNISQIINLNSSFLLIKNDLKRGGDINYTVFKPEFSHGLKANQQNFKSSNKLEDKYISANNLSKKLEPNSEEIYDFGGGKNSPFGDEAIIIDAFNIPKNDNPDNKIHDLNQYIKLSPRNLINISYSFYNFQNSPEIKKTIDDALKTRGYLVVQDYNNTLEKLKSIFQNYNILYEYVGEGDPDPDEGDDGFYVIVFQK